MPLPHVAPLGVGTQEPSPSVEDTAEDRGYPRPLLRRPRWESLNGNWDYAPDVEGQALDPRGVRFEQQIEVPFSPETERSGLAETGLRRACWYRRSIALEPASEHEQHLLHFGAVDYRASVYVDGALAARHEGGFTPFSVELTRFADGRREHELIVHAEDDPLDLEKPRGKQDWRVEPHSIWYPRTTGIWQTVWREPVGRTRIDAVRFTPVFDRWELELFARVRCVAWERLWLRVRLCSSGVLLSDDRYAVVGGEVRHRIGLSDPGIDDLRGELLWSPENPRLIEVELELEAADGRCLDVARSYTAMRSFCVDGERFTLNGRPYPLRLVLDQGYWPESGLTAPSDAALRRDVELAKRMGFNGVRKHQKIEDPRYLYWADHLGLLVWAEMPSAYRFSARSIERLTREWTEVLRRDAGHPCIVAWVPFNESWGVPDLPTVRQQRHYVEALYHLTKALDPTRPVIGNDGWESVATDVLGIHDYDADPVRLAGRYGEGERERLLARERPGGRALLVGDGPRDAATPLVLSEFGGVAFGEQRADDWGYTRAASAREFSQAFQRLMASVRSLGLFAGFCYTQFADTYQEVNGLLYADRRPKLPFEVIARAVTGVDGELRPGGAPPAEAAREGEGPHDELS